jgi:hypothetical protein
MHEYDKARELLSTYFEVLNEMETLEAQLKTLKTALTEQLIESGSKKIGFEGLGIVQMTEPTTIVTYEKKAIDQIKDQALRDGDINTANALANAQSISTRSGSLRIVKHK